MKDIVTKDGCFKYRWINDLFGQKGCDVCDLKNDKYCPENCSKDGCYSIMSFDEMKYEHLHQVMKECGIKMGKKL